MFDVGNFLGVDNGNRRFAFAQNLSKMVATPPIVVKPKVVENPENPKPQAIEQQNSDVGNK